MRGLTKLPQLTAGQRRQAENDRGGDQDRPPRRGRAARHRAILRRQNLGDLRMDGPSPAAACTDSALKVRTKTAKATTFTTTKAD
jgi:hypothetical protein